MVYFIFYELNVVFEYLFTQEYVKIDHHKITITGNYRKVVFFMTWYIDVDIAKETHRAAMTNQHDKILIESFVFKNSKNRFDLFLNLILSFNKNLKT